MKYVALLRRINAGGARRVGMARLKSLCEELGCLNVSTYINSGNVIFESEKEKGSIRKDVVKRLRREFDFDIPVLVKERREMRIIAEAIPAEWRNDPEQRTDVAYLFKEIDTRETIDELPVNREYMDIRYVKGAIFWNIDRKNYNKSRLNKLIGHEYYQLMTLRNANTARFLADMK